MLHVKTVKIPLSMNLNMKPSNIFYRQKPSNNEKHEDN